MTIAMMIAGLALLLVGGDLLVRGAVSTASALGVPPLVIGLTLVGFGTSTPELMTSVQAALAGSPGVAVGNVVGSNICNILLILGIAAMIRPVEAAPGPFRRDGPVLAGATALCLAVLLAGGIGRLAGAAFVALLAAYVWAALAASRGAAAAPAGAAVVVTADRRALVRGVPMALAGLGLVILGAGWLVDSAISIAAGLGVSDALIGLTIVAVGTSLPELTASVVAAWRGQSDVAFGNVVGSNIYNILGILGTTALVRPTPAPPEIMGFDGWVMTAATAALIAAAITGGRVSRAEGAAMLAGYAAYLGWLITGAA
jgi:cation:H+ antiporter